MRKYILLILTFVAAISLTSCGKGDTPSTNSSKVTDAASFYKSFYNYVEAMSAAVYEEDVLKVKTVYHDIKTERKEFNKEKEKILNKWEKELDSFDYHWDHLTSDIYENIPNTKEAIRELKLTFDRAVYFLSLYDYDRLDKIYDTLFETKDKLANLDINKDEDEIKSIIRNTADKFKKVTSEVEEPTKELTEKVGDLVYEYDEFVIDMAAELCEKAVNGEYFDFEDLDFD